MRRPLRRTLLALASLAAALVVADVVVALAWPVRTTTYRLDPVLLHDAIPGSRRLQRMPAWAGGGRHLVRFDAAGCRGPELDQPKQRPRIVVVGDSLVLAANLDEDDTFPARLARELPGCEVVNAGVESYGPDQTLLRLRRDFERLDPDLVVLVLCATNDFGDLLRNKLFELRDDELVRVQPVLSDVAREPFERHAREAAAPALWRAYQEWKETRARAAEEARASGPLDLVPEYLDQTAWEYRNTVLDRDRTVYSLQQDAYDADVALRPASDSARYKARLMTAVLNELRETCDTRDVPVAAIVVPSAVDLDPTFRIRVDRARFPDYDPARLERALADCARAAGLPVLDLPTFHGEPHPETLFVGREDFHWSAHGAALAAADCAAGLREARLVPAAR